MFPFLFYSQCLVVVKALIFVWKFQRYLKSWSISQTMINLLCFFTSVKVDSCECLLKISIQDTFYSSKVLWLFNTTVKEPASFSIDAEVDNFLFFLYLRFWISRICSWYFSICFKGYFCFDYLDTLLHSVCTLSWSNLSESKIYFKIVKDETNFEINLSQINLDLT